MLRPVALGWRSTDEYHLDIAFVLYAANRFDGRLVRFRIGADEGHGRR